MRTFDAGLKRVLLLTLGVKLFSYGIILAAYHFLPFNLGAYWHNFHYPADSAPDWLSAFKTWDAQCYLYLAQYGYGPIGEPDAFYPLFSFFISQVKFLFLGHTLFTGLLLSLLFTLTAVGFLYRFVEETWGEKTAFQSCLAFLAFPTAFYMGLVYTEPLFLALAIGFFYFFRKNLLAPAALCAFLLALTRPTGSLVLIPALVDLWQERGKWREARFRQKCLVPLGFLLGNLSFLLIMKATTGDYWTYAKIQSLFVNQSNPMNWLHPLQWFLSNFVHNAWTFNGMTTSAMNRLCFVLMTAALAVSFKKPDAGLWTYSLVVGLSLGLVGDLVSFPRYALAAFPLFIWASLKFGDKLFYYWIPAFLLQALLLISHALNNWVA